MEIIAHRGLWEDPHEKNSLSAFKKALDHGFGIETDVRDFGQKLTISHDIPDPSSLTLEHFLSVVSEKNANVTLALNIKSDGLQTLLKKHGELKSIKHFYFDMSIPDLIDYQSHDLPFYTRVSDIENIPIFYEYAKGIWLDDFHSNELNLILLEKFLFDGKQVALVSPELHNFGYTQYWQKLKLFIEQNPSFSDNIELCTDNPRLAKEFFGDKPN